MTSPRALCWAAKYRRLRPPIILTTSSITPSTAKVISVSTGLRTSIMRMVPAKFSVQETTLPKLLFSASEMVSISLV